MFEVEEERLVDARVVKNTLEEFIRVQKYMESAKEENAEQTYAFLKRNYIELKAILEALGVYLSSLDYINEQ